MAGWLPRVRRTFREAGVAAFRLLLAAQLLAALCCTPFLFLGLEGYLFIVALATPLAMVAAPLAPFARWIWDRRWPYLGTGWVVPPLYLLGLVSLGALHDHAGIAVMLIFVASIPGFVLLTAAYLCLWSLGDRWFGAADAPRRGRRWVFGVVLGVLTCVWIPFVVREDFVDRRLDRGGGMTGAWTCTDPTVGLFWDVF